MASAEKGLHAPVPIQLKASIGGALLLAVLHGTAVAADVTDLPPVQGLSVRLSYDGAFTTGTLEEDGETISGRQVTRHDLLWRAEVSPAKGLAINVGLEHSPGILYRYPDARPMIFEPSTGAGTYLFSRPGPDTEVRIAGVSGVWLGAAVTPYSETFDKQHQATWRLDVALRPASPRRNIWVARNGKRGPAPGGTAVRISAAFSKDLGTGNPYLAFAFQNEGKVQVDLEDEAGTVHAKGVQLEPASTVEMTGGAEIIAWQDADNDRRVAADLWLTAGYRTWQDVGSGVLLPNVLDGSLGIPVTSGEAIYARAGVGADVHMMAALRTRTGVWVGWESPTRVEHVYAVTTAPETLTIGWSLTLEGRTPFAGALRSGTKPDPTAAR
jgi:hypothetical protein